MVIAIDHSNTGTTRSGTAFTVCGDKTNSYTRFCSSHAAASIVDRIKFQQLDVCKHMRNTTKNVCLEDLVFSCRYITLVIAWQ